MFYHSTSLLFSLCAVTINPAERSQPKPFVIFLFSDSQYMSSLIWQQLNFKNSVLKISNGLTGSESGNGYYAKTLIVPIL